MQRNKISFKGQKIYIGIDVHAKTWEVCVLTESGYRERHPQQASAKTLFDFLKKHFPDGEYHAVYESGFSGFATYYALKEYGIDCVVTRAADVPTTQYEEVMKTDKTRWMRPSLPAPCAPGTSVPSISVKGRTSTTGRSSASGRPYRNNCRATNQG